MLEMNEDREISRMQDVVEAAAAELDGIDAEYVEWLLSAWISDDQGNAGIALQMAAAAEFGCSVPTWLHSNGVRDVSDAQAILRWLQNNSGAYAMTVYRGTSGKEGLPLESWTEDRAIAEFYAERNGGEVVERNVTADEILTTWRSGFGLECAMEVIIINR